MTTASAILSSRHVLAQRLRDLRLARGWSQDDLAEVVGIHRPKISYYENARVAIDLDTLDLLATAFGLEPADLLKSGP